MFRPKQKLLVCSCYALVEQFVLPVFAQMFSIKMCSNWLSTFPVKQYAQVVCTCILLLLEIVPCAIVFIHPFGNNDNHATDKISSAYSIPRIGKMHCLLTWADPEVTFKEIILCFHCHTYKRNILTFCSHFYIPLGVCDSLFITWHQHIWSRSGSQAAALKDCTLTLSSSVLQWRER